MKNDKLQYFYFRKINPIFDLIIINILKNYTKKDKKNSQFLVQPYF